MQSLPIQALGCGRLNIGLVERFVNPFEAVNASAFVHSMIEGAKRNDAFPRPFGKASTHANALGSPQYLSAKRPCRAARVTPGSVYTAIAGSARSHWLAGRGPRAPKQPGH